MGPARTRPEEAGGDLVEDQQETLKELYYEKVDADSAKVFRYLDGLSADVVFSEADGKDSVSVSFTVTEDGSWRLVNANAVQRIERR